MAADREPEHRAGRTPRERLLPAIAATALLAALVCFLVSWSQKLLLMADLSAWGYDVVAVADRFAPPRDDLVVVDFDDASIARIGRFPVPRAALAEVIRRVSAGAPQLIGVDMLLLDARSPEEDQDLALALRQAKNVVLAALMSSPQIPAQYPLALFCVPDPDAASYCKRGALGIGFVNVPIDDDGYIRRLFLLPPRGLSMYPFAVLLASNFSRQELKPSPDGVRFGQHTIPFGSTYRIGTWKFQPARQVPVHRLLAAEFNAASLRGKLVLIGSSSEAGRDRHFTPLFRVRSPGGDRRMLAGTQLQAAAITTLLEGKAIRDIPSEGVWALNLWLVIPVVLLILLWRSGYAVLLMGAIAVALFLLARYLFSRYFLWLDFVPGEFCLLAALPAAFGLRYALWRSRTVQVTAKSPES